MDDSVSLIAFAFLMMLVYFIPCFVAAIRDHPNGMAIALLNLFLGWTLLGWVAALVWSASAFDVTASAKATGQQTKAPSPGGKPPSTSKDRRPQSGEKTCPDCAETVKAAAKVCRFCGYRFDGTAPNSRDKAATAAPLSGERKT